MLSSLFISICTKFSSINHFSKKIFQFSSKAITIEEIKYIRENDFVCLCGAAVWLGWKGFEALRSMISMACPGFFDALSDIFGPEEDPPQAG
jgi:hypothetical protein